MGMAKQNKLHTRYTSPESTYGLTGSRREGNQDGTSAQRVQAPWRSRMQGSGCRRRAAGSGTLARMLVSCGDDVQLHC
jgi:hypothetical protein